MFRIIMFLCARSSHENINAYVQYTKVNTAYINSTLIYQKYIMSVHINISAIYSQIWCCNAACKEQLAFHRAVFTHFPYT